MKRLLIIYPHWPPSNLAGVHRPRLIANFSQEFDWDVTVLTVHESFYEEQHDMDMLHLVAPHIQVEKVSALPVLKILGRRLIGDIGIRSFFQLRKRLLELCAKRHFDFVWIPIPSWYSALLGPFIARKCKLKYGIDYIDPWVYQLTEYEKPFRRAWFTRQIALLMEPIALKRAKLVSGVSAEYFEPAIKRNFTDSNGPRTIEMPYGFDPNDHTQSSSQKNFPFDPSSGPYVLYAGAFLPQSEKFVCALFNAVQQLEKDNAWMDGLKFRFVGTGLRPGKSIQDLALEKKIDHLVFEHPERISFLDVQELLKQSQFNLIVGSTEPHYTASKTFQCLLSGRPLMAIFHSESSALKFLSEAQADQYSVGWSESSDQFLVEQLSSSLQQIMRTNDWRPRMSALDAYSAKESARVLFKAIDQLIK